LYNGAENVHRNYESLFFLYMFTSRESNRKRQKADSQVTPELWVLGVELGFCYYSGACNLEVVDKFMENLRTFF